MNQSLLALDFKSRNRINDYFPDTTVINALESFFAILSDATRLKLLSALSISEMCVNDLSVVLKLNQTTVSHQLKNLKDIGVVKAKRQGKVIFYSIANKKLDDVMLSGVEFLGY